MEKKTPTKTASVNARFWLMKSEPSVFSFDDLVHATRKTTAWEGVRNYQARNLMRDDFRVGDRVLFYHSGVDEPVIPGLAEVSRPAYPDPFAMDPKSDYYDADAKKKGINPWVLVDVTATHRFQTPVTRDMLKNQKGLASMMVLKKGARLSVQPVTAEEFSLICELGKPRPV